VGERRTPKRGLVAAGIAILALVAGLVWWGWPDPVAPTATRAAPTPAATSASPQGPCARPAAHPFVPATLDVTGVRSVVEPVPRDSGGIMGVLPEGDKTMFATDLGGVRAGASRGRLLLNTHTWPDGSAMGNRLLARLHVGGLLVLRGHGETACYQVYSREQVLASNGYPGWDRSTGRPGAVIVVCSGKRLGPEDWTHRTLWFARPYFGGSVDA
jgi:hypothetical protein